MPSVDRVFTRNGSYHYDLGRDENGKRRSKKLCRIDAGEHALLEALAKVTKPAATTVRDMYETFLRRGMAELAPRTRLDYCSYRDALYAVFGDCDPSDVEPHEIAQYLEKRSAKKLANKEIAALSSAYNHAMRHGLAKTNPCRGVRRNKVKPRDRYIRDDEFRAVLELPWPSEALWRRTVAGMLAILQGDDIDASREVLRGLLGAPVPCQPDGQSVVARIGKRRVLLTRTGSSVYELVAGACYEVRIPAPTRRLARE